MTLFIFSSGARACKEEPSGVPDRLIARQAFLLSLNRKVLRNGRSVFFNFFCWRRHSLLALANWVNRKGDSILYTSDYVLGARNRRTDGFAWARNPVQSINQRQCA